MIRSSAIALVLGLALPVLAPAAAQANERHFTYTYESATLPTGAGLILIAGTFLAAYPKDVVSERARQSVALSKPGQLARKGA